MLEEEREGNPSVQYKKESSNSNQIRLLDHRNTYITLLAVLNISIEFMLLSVYTYIYIYSLYVCMLMIPITHLGWTEEFPSLTPQPYLNEKRKHTHTQKKSRTV